MHVHIDIITKDSVSIVMVRAIYKTSCIGSTDQSLCVQKQL